MDNTLSKIVGQRINARLAERNKKQKELAAALNVTDNTVSYYCSGTRLPNTSQIKIIAEFLDCSADYLLGLSDTPTNDKDMRYMCDYTGLSEKAIRELRECINTEYYTDLVPDYQNLWIMETIPDFKEVLNQIIESGCMRKVVGLISDYYRSMEMATDVCNDLLKPLEEINSHNRVSGTDNMTIYEPLELIEILTEQKEIRLHYYEIQECLKSFVKHYREKTIKAYSDKTKEFNTVYNEYERLTRHYYDERLTRQEGEARGNNQETQ
jgi:transcriptional regulator with XRE-family HTH domain